MSHLRSRTRTLAAGVAFALSITLGGCSMTAPPSTGTPLEDYQTQTEQLAESLLELIPDAAIDSRSPVESDSRLATDGRDEWPKYWYWHGEVYLLAEGDLTTTEAAETLGESLLAEGWTQSASGLSSDERTVTEYRRDGWFLDIDAELLEPPMAQAVRLTVLSPDTDH